MEENINNSNPTENTNPEATNGSEKASTKNFVPENYEAIVERKLALMELDYQMTLAATIKQRDDTGKELEIDTNTGNKQDDTPQQEENDEEENEKKEGEDWEEFQGYAQLGSDEEEGNNDLEVEEAPEEKPVEQKSKETAPYTQEQINKIKGAMSKINIKPPEWATKISEDEWVNAFLKKQGKK